MTGKAKRLIDRLKKLQGSPGSLARGAAVGVFMGFAPLVPLKTILILAITVPTGCSTVAAVLVCTIICNPLTYVPLYYLAWLVGNLVLPGRISWSVLEATLAQMGQLGTLEALRLAGQVGFEAGVVVLLGGLVLALPPALISYPLALRFFTGIARQRAARHLLNNPDHQEDV